MGEKVGGVLDCVADLRAALEAARSDGLDFACVPLFHPRLVRDGRGVSCRRESMGTRSDLVLSGAEWSRLVVGVASAWPDLAAGCAPARSDGEAALRFELAHASHLSLSAVLLGPLPRDVSGVARCVCEALQRVTSWQCWVRCRLVSRELEEARREGRHDGGGDPWDPWARWDALRRLCDHTAGLVVALELSEELPSRDAARRWRGEPIRALIVPCAIFRKNGAGFPVLGKGHQALVLSLAALEPQLVVSGRPRKGTKRGDYVAYVRHLLKNGPQAKDDGGVAALERPYRDFLQAPLQPLADNLESATYETFERDPVKYGAGKG